MGALRGFDVLAHTAESNVPLYGVDLGGTHAGGQVVPQASRKPTVRTTTQFAAVGLNST